MPVYSFHPPDTWSTLFQIRHHEHHSSPRRIKNWHLTILYEPPKSGKFNGKLLVTNKRLLYDAKFDYSAKGILEEFLYIKWGSEGFLEISKEDIVSVEVQNPF